MTEQTYTDRRLDLKVIESIKDGTVQFADGWCFGGVPDDVLPQLVVGQEYLQETRRFSLVTGMADSAGNWLWRKTDADLDREHAEMVARIDAERQKFLLEHQDDWLKRESLLPLSLRRRLDRYHANGGEDFKRNGWGYELAVCELAVLYARSGQEDSEEIDAYAEKYGTSGNQHDCAKALSRHLTDDPADEDLVANSVSALAPLTGNADWSKSQESS